MTRTPFVRSSGRVGCGAGLLGWLVLALVAWGPYVEISWLLGRLGAGHGLADGLAWVAEAAWLALLAGMFVVYPLAARIARSRRGMRVARRLDAARAHYVRRHKVGADRKEMP